MEARMGALWGKSVNQQRRFTESETFTGEGSLMPCGYLVLSPFSGIWQKTKALLSKGDRTNINIRYIIHCHTDNQLVYPAHQFICYSSVYAIKSNIKKNVISMP